MPLHPAGPGELMPAIREPLPGPKAGKSPTCFLQGWDAEMTHPAWFYYGLI